MISNKTTPTVIVDKNGKTTTVHKTTAAPGNKTRIPLPPLPPKRDRSILRGPTPAQMKRSDRKVSYTEGDVDPDLYRVCVAEGISPENRYSDVEMYDLIAVVKRSRNAELLMSAGIRHPDQAVKFLKQVGLSHLIEDTHELIGQAIDRRIPVNVYLKHDTMREHHATEYLMDSLEVLSHRQVLHLNYPVLQGDIKLSDLKTIGYKIIGDIDLPDTKSFLKSVSDGSSGITPEDIVAMRKSSYSSNIFNVRLKLARRHGAELGKEATGNVSMGLRMSHVLQDRGITDNDYACGFIKFVSELHYESTEKYGYSLTKYSEDDYFLFHDLGLSVQEIMDQEISVEKAKAIKDGSVNKSIASGWL